MQNEKIDLIIDPHGSSEFTLREGQAAPIREPERFIVKGRRITAPAAYWEAQSDRYEPEDCVVVVERDDLTKPPQIKLTCNFKEELSDVVEGVLEYDQSFQEFKINTSQTWTTKALAKHLKRYRTFFANQDEGAAVITSLMNFEAKVTQVQRQSQDNRGNFSAAFDQVVESDFPDTFSLEVPIYKGEEKVKFSVEVALDLDGNTVVCSLESPTLTDFIVKQRDAIVERELTLLNTLTIIE